MFSQFKEFKKTVIKFLDRVENNSNDLTQLKGNLSKHNSESELRNEYNEGRHTRAEITVASLKGNVEGVEAALIKLQNFETNTNIEITNIQASIGKNSSDDDKNLTNIKKDMNDRFLALSNEKKEKKGSVLKWITISIASLALLKEGIIEILKRIFATGGP